MDLNIGGAIKYVQGQMDHWNTTEKKLLQDIKQNKDKEAEQQEEDIEYQKTNNDVFNVISSYQILIKSAT